MEKLMTKMDNLLKVLDKNIKIKEVKKLKEEVFNNDALVKLITEYNNTKNNDLKNSILKNELFQEYKSKETELNILILEINQKLKELTKRGNCSL